ncbi:MAG TPA: FkbM family methyltransferase [Rhabdochlamydiaceae bacterium]|nr:FkbM family methyltransferase [Rhabdochlamydiaceae bacterium]
MRSLFVLFGFIVLSCSSAYGTVFYEGTAAFSKYREINWSWIRQLVPDKPVIVDVGVYYGLDTCKAAQLWPEAEIFALEANPRAYVEMLKHINERDCNRIKTHYLALGDHNGTAPFYLCKGPNGDDISYDHASSLLPPSPDLGWRTPKIEVPCMILDDWCQLNNIEHIDILKLELEGFELQALQCSPNILKKVKIIWLQSFFSSDRIGMTNYFWLKDFLYKSNFVVLAHWYTQGGRGSAIYVSQELFKGLQ